MMQGGFWVCTETRVHRRGLDDSAARRDEPVEAFGWRHGAKGMGSGLSSTQAHEVVELTLNGLQVKIRGHCQNTLLVKVDEHTKKTTRSAEEYNANVDAFTPLNTWHEANDSIIIGAGRGHVEPPLQRYAKMPGGPADRQDRPHDGHHSRQRAGHPQARDRGWH